jgi:hypothetical protein
MEASSAAVSGMRPPRFEGNRMRGVLGCGVAVFAAVLCASLFTAPARGDDPPSPIPGGSAVTTDSTPSDAAAAAPSDVTAPTETADTSAPTTDSSGTAETTDTRAPAPDAIDISATMADGSVAAANTAGAGTPAPDAIDTSATTAPNPIDTTAATTPDTIAIPATTTDNSAAAPDTTSTCALVPDATATSATTTDTSAAAAETTGSCAPAPVPTDTTDGLTAIDPSASAPDASGVEPTDAAAAAASITTTTDPIGTSTGTAPATDTRSLSSSGSSGAGEPPASPPGSNLQAPSDVTTSDSLPDAKSNDEDADSDPLPGDVVQPFATAVLSGEAMTLIFSVIVIPCGADCLITIVCDPTPRSLPLASCSTEPGASRAERIAVRTNGAQSPRPAGVRGPSAPRLPIPDNEPQMPTPAGASSGSGSSGGPHGGFTLGVTAAVLDITPRDDTRPITLNELCRRALPLAFLLDRPG